MNDPRENYFCSLEQTDSRRNQSIFSLPATIHLSQINTMFHFNNRSTLQWKSNQWRSHTSIYHRVAHRRNLIWASDFPGGGAYLQRFTLFFYFHLLHWYKVAWVASHIYCAKPVTSSGIACHRLGFLADLKVQYPHIRGSFVTLKIRGAPGGLRVAIAWLA